MTLTTDKLRRMLSLREQIDKLEQEYARISNGHSIPTPARTGRKLSAAARKKIADKVRARWKEAKAKGKTKL